MDTRPVSRPTRGMYAFDESDLLLGKRLVEAAMVSNGAFTEVYDAAGLAGRRQKVADLCLLLTAISGVALRMRWPVQRHRPRSRGDVDKLVHRVSSLADPARLDPHLCRDLVETFVRINEKFGGVPSTRDGLYTVAATCGVAVTNSLENAGTASDWDTRFRRAFRAIRRRIRVGPSAPSS